MKKEKRRDPKIDDLLKQALKDDLPLEAESAMKRQLNLFREKMEGHEPRRKMKTGRILQGLLEGRGFRQVQWILKKGVPAFASIIMVILGSFLQIKGSQSPLAESISTLKAAAFVTQELNQTESMVCSVQIFTEDDKFLRFSIQWLSPDRTRVCIEKRGKIPSKTLWLTDEEIAIADHEKNTLRKVQNFEQTNEPQFQPVMNFLSPSSLVERIRGKWKLKHYRYQGDCEWGTFTLTTPREKALMEITVDLCTYLPISIKKILPAPTKEGGEEKLLMNVHFKWNTPIPPQIMLPKIPGRS